MMRPIRQQPTANSQQPLSLLALVLTLFALLCLWYSLAVPAFETPDEPFHYAFARHIAAGNGLPVQDAEEPGPWAQEGSQAPLYYLLAGALTAPIDQSDFEQLAVRNRRANMGDPLFPGNKNFMLYSAVSPPLRGANLALHVGRWLSLLLGAVTLLCTYATARLAAGNDSTLPLLATLFVVLIPQFLFIHASFTNDTAIIAASAATVYWLARLLRTSQERRVRLWEWTVLGALLGVAALSKLQGLGLFALAALVGLWMAWQQRDAWLPLRAILPVALPPLLIAGWWYGRNYLLYGDALGLSHLLEINGQRERALSWGGLWGELRGLRYSFWGLFGWFNIPLPRPMYGVFDTVALLAGGWWLVAGGEWLWKRSERPHNPERNHKQGYTDQGQRAIYALLFLWLVLSLALLAYWISQATGSQGRLLFPAISAIGILLAAGIDGLLRRLAAWSGWEALRGAAWTLLFAFLASASLYTLGVLFPRSYSAPQPAESVPESAQRVELTYGDPARGQAQVTLVALEIAPGEYRPGDEVPVTVYLRADEAVSADYQFFIQFLDETGREVANLTSHPGWGRNPTSLWRAGAMYRDTYPVRISQPIGPESPLLATVYLGFIDPNTEEDEAYLPLRAYNSAGERVDPMPATVEIRPASPITAAEQGLTETPGAEGSEFGGVVRLAGYDVPEMAASGAITLPVTLLWEAVGTPATDYVAYVHLLNAAGERVAGADQPPSRRFPTGRWRAGDRVLSEFVLELPPDLAPGEYAAWVGFYEAGSRGAVPLPVSNAGTRETVHSRVRLERVSLH